MPHERKIFLRTVSGLILFGVVTIGIQAASHEYNRARTATVAQLDIKGYRVMVGETAQNPNDHMDSRGIHDDGYVYTCTLFKNGVAVSSYIVHREKGFHAEQVSIDPLALRNNSRVMVEIELRPASAASVVTDCMIEPPATDDKFGTGVIDWRTLDMDSM